MSQALLGLPCILFLAWLSSSDRRQFPLRLTVVGLAAQFLLALLLLKVPLMQEALLLINRAVLVVEAATGRGTAMVFGFLGGGEAPYEITQPEHSFILAFRALPLVVVFAALSALLWHWRIIPFVVNALAKMLRKSMNINGRVAVGAASSIFVGMVESPLLIKPYLASMSRADLFIVFTCGMATVAGTVLGLYATVLSNTMPDALSHLLIASLISAPAAILLALIMIPADTQGMDQSTNVASPYATSMEAIVTGTQEGLRLLASIIGMLIVFIALVYIVDAVLSLVPTSGEPLTLVGLFGAALRPLTWLLGIPWHETVVAGELLAVKIVINELAAFLQLAQLDSQLLSEKSKLILIYSLCGFANFGSLGIMIGGMTALCPERSADILQLAPRSIWSGLLASCMTGCVVGLIT